MFKKDGPDPDIKLLGAEITKLTKEVAKLTAQRDALAEHTTLTTELSALKLAKTKLEVELEQLKEAHAKETREIEHKLGLHKKSIDSERTIMKQEAEAERLQTVEAAKLAVREENLEAERGRFKEEIEFRTKRFEAESDTLKNLMNQVLERLPTVHVERRYETYEGEPPAHKALKK